MRNLMSSRCSEEYELERTVTLTPQESAVLAHILVGKSHKEVANSLNISERTAKFHASNLYQKHGVSGRDELIRLKQSGGSPLDWYKLTAQEQQISRLSVDHTWKEISRILSTSESTIGLRLRTVYTLLRVRGKTGLAAYMAHHGVLYEKATTIQ